MFVRKVNEGNKGDCQQARLRVITVIAIAYLSVRSSSGAVNCRTLNCCCCCCQYHHHNCPILLTIALPFFFLSCYSTPDLLSLQGSGILPSYASVSYASADHPSLLLHLRPLPPVLLVLYKRSSYLPTAPLWSRPQIYSVFHPCRPPVVKLG